MVESAQALSSFMRVCVRPGPCSCARVSSRRRDAASRAARRRRRPTHSPNPRPPLSLSSFSHNTVADNTHDDRTHTHKGASPSIEWARARALRGRHLSRVANRLPLARSLPRARATAPPLIARALSARGGRRARLPLRARAGGTAPAVLLLSTRTRELSASSSSSCLFSPSRPVGPFFRSPGEGVEAGS